MSQHPKVKLPALWSRRDWDAGDSRARSGERKAGKGSIVLIVALYPCLSRFGGTGHVPVKSYTAWRRNV